MSEIIEKLEEYKERYGDLKIETKIECFTGSYEITNVAMVDGNMYILVS